MKLMVILLGALLLHGSMAHALPLSFGDLDTAPVLNMMENAALPLEQGGVGESYALPAARGPDWQAQPGKKAIPPVDIFEQKAGCTMGIFLDPQAIWLMRSAPLPLRVDVFFRGFPPFPKWLYWVPVPEK